MKRENGCYWCKHHDGWEVCRWDDTNWWIPGEFEMFIDEFFKEIDERRIINPNE